MVGALIAARQPHNLVGWILCAAGLCFTLQSPAIHPYARYALVTVPGSLPGGVWQAPQGRQAIGVQERRPAHGDAGQARQ